MAQYTLQEIRAKITIGDVIIETPDVISFNVTRSRNTPTATFSASVKVPHDLVVESSQILNSNIIIEAGIKDSLKPVFTGIVYKCTVNPIRVDASKVILNLSGKDVLSLLDNQNVNRRVKTYRDGDRPPERWAAVTGVLKRDVPQAMKFPVAIVNNKLKASDKLPNVPYYSLSDELDKKVIEHIPSNKIDGTIQVTKIVE